MAPGAKAKGDSRDPKAEERGSRFITAQDEFVLRYGIRSVLGFGGSLHGGELFAIILFSKVRIPESSADRFRTLALDVKGGFSKFTEEQIFDNGVAVPA